MMTEPQRGQPGTWRYLAFWRGDGDMDLKATLGKMPSNDQDAAELIAAERPGELHHVPTIGRSGTWYIWNGKCHRPDDCAEAERLIMGYAARADIVLGHCRQAAAAQEAAQPEAASAGDVEKATAATWKKWDTPVKYHAGLKKTAGSRSLLAKLADLRGVSEEHMADRWPEHLNCANGIVSLRTGHLLPHDPRAMMTYCLPVPYVPGARCERWEQLLWNVTGKNPEVAAYTVRMLGYSCLGDNREQLIFFMHGKTGSGKSQVVEAVAGVLGPVAHSSGGALISRSRNERHARVENSIAGKRLITIDESAERVRVDEGQVKRLTGAARISRNQLYAAVETPVRVSGTIWQATNEMPTISGFDGAIKRRVRAVPCGSTIDEGAQEKKIAERLARDEGEAILASLVWGAMDYFANGESRPAEVELATAQYEAEQNTAAAFREECTMAVPDWNGDGHASWPTMAEIRKEYVAWCEATRTSCMPKHAFNTAFRALPGIEYQESSRRFLHLTVIQSYIRGKVGQDD